MVETQAVEDRGVQVVDVDLVLHHIEAEIIGLSDDLASLDSPSGHPHAEGRSMMVPPELVGLRPAVLQEGGTAELTSPDDEGGVEESPLLEIFYQGSSRLVRGGADTLQVLVQVSVVVPAAVKHLHEADAPLDQASGQEAIHGERLLPLVVDPVHVECAGGLLGKIEELRSATLHAESKLVGRNPGGDLGIPCLHVAQLVEVAQSIQPGTLILSAYTRRAGEVEYGVSGVSEGHSLEAGGQVATSPVGSAGAGAAA